MADPAPREFTVAVYCPTRGMVFCETAQALSPYQPAYVRDKVAIGPARNWICQDFLTADVKYDALVMVDDDVIPPAKFVEVLAAQPFDIVAGVVPITQPGKPFFPNAFRFNNQNQHQSVTEGIVMDRAIPVDSAGTGCILIHRRVLEHKHLSRPFDVGYDDHGIIIEGEDLAFCRRAKAAGFTVGAHFGLLCEHFTQVHANGLAASFMNYFGNRETEKAA